MTGLKRALKSTVWNYVVIPLALVGTVTIGIQIGRNDVRPFPTPAQQQTVFPDRSKNAEQLLTSLLIQQPVYHSLVGSEGPADQYGGNFTAKRTLFGDRTEFLRYNPNGVPDSITFKLKNGLAELVVSPRSTYVEALYYDWRENPHEAEGRSLRDFCEYRIPFLPSAASALYYDLNGGFARGKPAPKTLSDLVGKEPAKSMCATEALELLDKPPEKARYDPSLDKRL